AETVDMRCAMRLARHRLSSIIGATAVPRIASVAQINPTRAVSAERSVICCMRHLAVLAGALLVWVAGPANAQTEFPRRPIHVIVPFPAGGIADVVTRIVTDKLSEMWHQPIVVEAKPGANGNLGWEQVARAAPDGYTWTFVSPGVMANPRI